MDDRLVFDLVWHHGIHPAFHERRTRCARALSAALCRLFPNADVTRERYVFGMVDLLHWMSERLLAEFDYPTEWRRVDKLDDYYPLRIRALNLERAFVSGVV